MKEKEGWHQIMYKRMKQLLKKYVFLSYAVFTVGVKKIIDLLFNLSGKFISDSFVAWFISACIVIMIAFLIDLICFVRKISHKKRKEEVETAIIETSKKYDINPYGEKIPMFSLDGEIEEKEFRPIFYYSLSVKKYINWIDFTFFRYLSDLKNELHSEVIIALHYDDKMRENRQNSEKNRKYYKALCKWYADSIKKIIGNDTIILFEDEFYRQNAKEYRTKFHAYYAESILNTATRMEINNQTNDAKKLENYKTFMRNISNLESAFPIYCVSKYYQKKRKLFVIDRKGCLESWNNDPFLKSLKKEYPFQMIFSETLTDEKNKKIDIHSEDVTPNFTDSEEVFKEKLTKLYSHDVLVLMATILKHQNYVPEDLIGSIVDSYRKINQKYDLKAFREDSDI